jgi:hypothetical protein
VTSAEYVLIERADLQRRYIPAPKFNNIPPRPIGNIVDPIATLYFPCFDVCEILETFSGKSMHKVNPHEEPHVTREDVREAEF